MQNMEIQDYVYTSKSIVVSWRMMDCAVKLIRLYRRVIDWILNAFG